MEVTREYLRARIEELEQTISSGLSFEDKTLLASLKNMTDNISIWACRGTRDNFEIIYWNKGAEMIYDHSAADALGKNCTELFISDDERQQAREDIERIINGTPMPNFVAHDVNKEGEEIIVVTNTFRIADIERGRGFVQVEIGLNVTDLPEFKDHRGRMEMRAQFSTLRNIVEKAVVLNKLPSNLRSFPEILQFLTDGLTSAFGSLADILVLAEEDQNLNIPSFIFGSNETLISKSQEISSLLKRVRTKENFFEKNTISVPVYLPKIRDFVCLFHISLVGRAELNEEESWALRKIGTELQCAFKYLVLLNDSRR
jgi:PAS domain S-box-containing protein